jgi:hypothetical protein
MQRYVLAAAIAWFAGLPPAQAQTNDPCSGHQALPKPRAESSCLTIKLQVTPSPDKALRAVVLPVDVDLNTTPDMESRVVMRTADGKTLTSKDYSSPRGANGYYVVRAAWSPDSQFFVYSTSSSGGHSPWQFPTWVYGRQKNIFVSFSKLISDNPITSESFKFTGPHTVVAQTWDKPGSDNRISVTVDLGEAFAKLPASEN